MSAKYPEWYELPKKRWQETSIQEVQKWNAETRQYTYTGEMVKKRIWRDSQRQKLYDAENRAKSEIKHGDTKVSIPLFATIEKIEGCVNKLLTSTWITKRFGPQKIPNIIHKEGTSAYAYVGKGILCFPKWSWNELIVLHEVSHWIHPSGYGTHHGRFFCRALLELTGHKLGPTFRTILKEAYRFYSVKFSPFPAYSTEVLARKRESAKQLTNRRHA